MFENKGVTLLRTSCVAAQPESRKDSGMVVAAGFSAAARPARLLSLDVTSIFQNRGVTLLRTSRVAA